MHSNYQNSHDSSRQLIPKTLTEQVPAVQSDAIDKTQDSYTTASLGAEQQVLSV